MYEDRTFENILREMLASVSEKAPELDTRVGSVIYTALAPIAMELETAYHEMSMIVDETFLETASKEYLMKHGDQMGVELKQATFGHFRGEFNADAEIAIGSRFSTDNFNYSVIGELNSTNAYKHYELVCETAGSEPNSDSGELIPITYIKKLSYAQLTGFTTPGEDEEDTETYRYRLQIHAKNPPINGNVAQYNEWLDNYDGVGKYRVVPGKNKVSLIILNSNNGSADEDFVKEVQDYFDPTFDGMGNGVAPIGAVVTVSTVEEAKVTINCTVILKEGYTSTDSVKSTVGKYLNSLALNKTTVDYMPLSAQIYNDPSVESVENLSVIVKNTTMSLASGVFSVSLGDNEIPVLDTASEWKIGSGQE